LRHLDFRNGERDNCGVKAVVAAVLVIVVCMTGCRTAPVDPDADVVAQIAELSRRLDRLDERLNEYEKNLPDFKASASVVQRVIDEMRYEPLVEEKLEAAP